MRAITQPRLVKRAGGCGSGERRGRGGGAGWGSARSQGSSSQSTVNARQFTQPPSPHCHPPNTTDASTHQTPRPPPHPLHPPPPRPPKTHRRPRSSGAGRDCSEGIEEDVVGWFGQHRSHGRAAKRTHRRGPGKSKKKLKRARRQMKAQRNESHTIRCTITTVDAHQFNKGSRHWHLHQGRRQRLRARADRVQRVGGASAQGRARQAGMPHGQQLQLQNTQRPQTTKVHATDRVLGRRSESQSTQPRRASWIWRHLGSSARSLSCTLSQQSPRVSPV